MNAFCSDLHVHTNRSFCSPAEITPQSYLPFCAQEGIRVLGFSNHVYPTPVIHSRGFVDQTALTRLTSLRPELQAAAQQTDVKLLLGCEMEIFPATGPALTAEEAAEFDYILVAASHILNIEQYFTGIDYSTPDKLRKVMIDQFFAACQLDYPVPTGICHPLYPICSPDEQEVVDGISDACLNECFSLAAEKNISIEIHACLYRDGTRRNAEGLSDSYLRILAAAKRCGCKFHFGTDAHKPDMFVNRHALLHKAAAILGITQQDLWQPARLPE